MRRFDYKDFQSVTWDNDIVSLIAQIHEYNGRQELFLKQKPKELNRLVEIAKIQSTESSNKIEGIITTNTRIRELIAEKTAPRNRDEKEIAGYRDVLNLIHERYAYIPVKPAVILQLHRDLYKYSGSAVGGRYKNTQNYISARTADGKEFTLFTPLAPYETPDAMEQICSAYDTVKRAIAEHIGDFTKKEILEKCAGLSDSSVEASIKKLCEEGRIQKIGNGRATRYLSVDRE